MESATKTAGARAIAFQLWVGVFLIALFWPLNWLLPGRRTHLLFFPLWLGYILAVDGLVWQRRRTSLLTRNWRAFVGLFAASVPVWWLFELLNWRTQNWEYLGSDQFSPLSYFVHSSLNFSTVMPAVFGTAELVSSFGWLQRFSRGPVVRPTGAVTRGFLATGLVMLVAMLIWPRLFFPFIWLSLYFVLAPLNVWLGNRSLAWSTAVGDWRPVAAVAAGALICGFFWEMWNFYALPKWVYHVPPYEFLYIFEMPLLGYGGYLPFGLELFAVYHLLIGVLGLRLSNYVQLGEAKVAKVR